MILTLSAFQWCIFHPDVPFLLLSLGNHSLLLRRRLKQSLKDGTELLLLRFRTVISVITLGLPMNTQVFISEPVDNKTDCTIHFDRTTEKRFNRIHTKMILVPLKIMPIANKCR